jgi:hypothetical protein
LSDPNALEEMEKLGIEMVGHCKGLPLGIIVLGGILVNKRHLVDWKNVHRNIKSVIRRGESREKEHGGVSQILELSYSDLPYYLKPCFLYLSKFREDADMDAEGLYQLWMAESMVMSNGKGEGETMMDVAESYLGELAQRTMVQVQLNDGQGYEFKKFNSCRMHDMMRELCLSKAKEEDFFQTVDLENEDGVGSDSSSISARRAVIYFKSQDFGSSVVSINKKSGRRLRSLLLLNDGETTYAGRMPRMVKSHLSDFRLLRSLAIEQFSPSQTHLSIKVVIDIISDYFTLPNAIGTLIHLRYLSLEKSIFIMFPTCIEKLIHLQTLVLRGCEFMVFTRCMEKVLSKMSELQHLYLPHSVGYKVSGSKLKLGNLINLEILDDFDPSWCRTEDLMKLINLRKFGATVMSNHLEATQDIISYLSSTKAKNIRDASLEISRCKFATEEWQTILTQLLGSSCVHKLILRGPITINLPRYNNISTLPSRLTQLHLYESKLEEDPMPILAAFPHLFTLLLSNAFRGKKMRCSSNGFFHLRCLEICKMYQLQSLEIEDGAMPRLSKLEFQECDAMNIIPYGLRFVTSLQTLRITTQNKKFKRKVRAVCSGVKGEDFETIGHIPSIIIVDY